MVAERKGKGRETLRPSRRLSLGTPVSTRLPSSELFPTSELPTSAERVASPINRPSSRMDLRREVPTIAPPFVESFREAFAPNLDPDGETIASPTIRTPLHPAPLHIPLSQHQILLLAAAGTTP